MTLTPELLPFYLLILVGVAGIIRAMYVYFRWLAKLPLSKRVAFVAINIAPVLILTSSYKHYSPYTNDSSTTIYLVFGIFFGLCNLVVLACSSIAHAVILVQVATSYFQQLPRWHKVLSIGVAFDWLVSWVLGSLQ